MGKHLRDYRKKRDFRKTPEPAPRPAIEAVEDSAFVVHRHEATRLHYDLRLRMDGVLKSFAVPRGFSYVTSDRHLAVRTEDHPLEYETFEGVIPAGQYGAGTMAIWDHGSYAVLNDDDPVRALEAGKLEIRFDGRRLHGEWHLVRTRTEKEKDWLLLKTRDRYAREAEDPPYPLDLDLAAAVRRDSWRAPTPMRPRETVEPFSDPGWLFELAFDGLRVFAEKRDDGVRLRAGGTVLEDPPREVVAALRAMRANEALVEGVLVARDTTDRPSRDRLDRRLAGTDDAPVELQAFDLLQYDAWQLKSLPLVERKRLLVAVLPASPSLIWVDHVVGEGERLSGVVAAAGLTGVVAKDAASGYRGGSSRAWRFIAVETETDRAVRPLGEALAARPRGRSGRVRLTNLRKVYWPGSGLTKGDLLAYYERVAEVLLPHLHERPLHMRRFPDGIEGKSFYHKDAPDHLPRWVETEAIASGDDDRVIRYVVCNDRDTLLALVNLGSVDLHPWMSRRGSLDTPDRLVFDLDPDRTPFPDVVRVARFLGRRLRGIGLRPHLKTSGASGLHVVVPLVDGYTYDQARMFAEMVARSLVRDHPDLCTVERSVARRKGRVYLDTGQNRRGQTVVPPYVARPVPAASVSTPLDWDELSVDLDPTRFTITTAPDRIAARGDLHRGVLTDHRDLTPAIAAFEEFLRG